MNKRIPYVCPILTKELAKIESEGPKLNALDRKIIKRFYALQRLVQSKNGIVGYHNGLRLELADSKLNLYKAVPRLAYWRYGEIAYRNL